MSCSPEIDGRVAVRPMPIPSWPARPWPMVWDSAGTFYVYKPADPRVEFTLDLGLVSAPSVDALATDESTFFSTLSYERLAELDKRHPRQLLRHAGALGHVPRRRPCTTDAAGEGRHRRRGHGTGIHRVGVATDRAVAHVGLDEYVDILSAAAAKVRLNRSRRSTSVM